MKSGEFRRFFPYGLRKVRLIEIEIMQTIAWGIIDNSLKQYFT